MTGFGIKNAKPGGRYITGGHIITLDSGGREIVTYLPRREFIVPDHAPLLKGASMSNSRIPVVGDLVWYHEGISTQPQEATVVQVFDDHDESGAPNPRHAKSRVNLDVVNPMTGEHSIQDIVHVGDHTTVHPHYRWPTEDHPRT